MFSVPSSKRPSAAGRGSEEAAALAELERVVESPAFSGSARQIRLLRFLVGEVLAGRGGELRAPLVAVRVFDRPEGFNPNEDSIVRVEMSKLRRALARYYAVTPASAVRIELPRGSYAPVFAAVASRSAQSGERPAVTPVEIEPAVVAVLPFAAVNAVSAASLPAVAPGSAPPPGSTGTRGRAFALGLTERLGALFAGEPGVLVVSRASTLDEAAARGARYVLEGTVRLLPGALRVTAKLHDTGRWVQVWGSSFDRFDAEDRLFAVEDEIAREITVQILDLPGIMGAPFSAPTSSR